MAASGTSYGPLGGPVGAASRAMQQAQQTDRLSNDSAPIREPEVPAAMSACDRSLTNLEELATHLESRLAPVLSPEAPSDTAKTGSRVYGSGLANAIGSFTDRTDSIGNRLAALLRRLELP